MKTVAERFDEKFSPEPNTGCWLWIGATNTSGYGQMVGRELTERLAHRVSWTFVNGPIPDGLCVLHRCDTPICVNPDHLFVGTRSDNQRDLARKGYRRSNRQAGITNGCSKLDDEKVKNIRLRYGTEKGIDIARRFGVSEALVSLIVHRRIWTHV